MELDDEIVEEMKAVRNSQSAVVRQRIAALILARPDEEIISFLVKRSEGPSPWQEVLDYVRALFFGLGLLAEEDEYSKAAKLLKSTFVNAIRLIHSQDLAVDNRLGDCVSYLIQEMESFPKPLLPSVSEEIMIHLERGERQDGVRHDDGSIHHLLEFLPRCLSLIASVSSVIVVGEDGEEAQTTGIQYRETVLRRLQAIRWSKKFVTKMVSLLRDISLDNREMEQFVRKLFIHMKDAEPQDLPSLVYQLLLLASKGYKRIVLAGMIHFFNKKHSQENTQRGRASSVNAAKLKASMDAFRQMEGTIVLHINFAVKQDPALGQEWLYLVRTNSWPLTPFLVSVLLSLGRIQRFEQPAFDLLRAAAVKCFRDCQQCRESRWAAAILGATSLQTAGKVEESFMRTVQSSAFGWDHIIPSVVRMGFGLVESTGPGRPRTDDSVRPAERVSGTQELGIRVLSAAFEAHEMARDEIIDQCKCRIIGQKPQHSAPILRMIVLLVQNCPQLMLEHSARLKECLDYFTLLHSTSASSLVKAISPLFQLSRDLQDYTVLVLRKAMFGREETGRMTAVRGLLDLVVSDKRARSGDSEAARSRFSEASCSQSSSQFDRSLGRPGNLLQDLLGLLRRCLSQQVSVKETLYQGLPKLLEVDPDSSDAVFDLIWPIFNRYYVSEQDSAAASLKLDSCVVVKNAAVRVIEPLDHLLSCVHRLLILRPQTGLGPGSGFSWTAFGLSETLDHDGEIGRFSSGECLAMAFKNLRKTVINSSLGDFYRDKTLDFSSETAEGEANMELARLLLGVVEVLIDSAVLDCVNQVSEVRRADSENELHAYLDLHDSLLQKVNQKQWKSTSKSSQKKASTKKGPGRPPKGVIGPGKTAEPKDTRKTGALLVSSTFVDKRKSFLSSTCIVYLLNSIATQLQSKRAGRGRDRPDEEAGAPPGTRPVTQGTSQREAAKGKDLRVASFALQNCLRHLKSMANEVVGQIDNSEVTDIDCQLLANPLFQVVVALRDSSMDAAPGCQGAPKEKGKTAKGKKSETEMGGGLMLTSLKCLEELIGVASRRSCLVEVIKHLDLDPNDMLEREEGNESDEDMISPGETKESIFQGSEAKRLHHWLTTQSHPLLEELLAGSFYSEIEVLCGIVQTLGSKLPQVLMKKHGTWAQLVCKGRKFRNVGAARSLTNMAICLSPPPDDVTSLQVFGAELLKVMGSEVREPVDSSDQYPMINKLTRTAIGSLLFHKAECVLVDLEWLASKLKIQASSEIPQLDRKTPMRPGGTQRMYMEETLHTRMETVIWMLSVFTSMTLNGVLAEHMLRVAMHFYKCFAAATRLLIAPKGFTQPLPSPLFQRLAELICKKLTPSVYNFMSNIQRDQQEGPDAGKESVSQIKRAGRTIPNLVFHIEESERYLLQLGKVSKMNLLRFAKRSTARDFRITDSGKKRKASAQEDVEHDEDSARESDAEPAPDGTVPEEEEEDEQQVDAEQDVGAQSDDQRDEINAEQEIGLQSDDQRDEVDAEQEIGLQSDDQRDEVDAEHEVRLQSDDQRDEIHAEQIHVETGAQGDEGERRSRPRRSQVSRARVILDSDEDSDPEADLSGSKKQRYADNRYYT